MNERDESAERHESLERPEHARFGPAWQDVESSAFADVTFTTDRLSVIGGWLVRVVMTYRRTIGSDDLVTQMTTTFVPDKEHAWKI
jgi:hypothetical protein